MGEFQITTETVEEGIVAIALKCSLDFYTADKMTRIFEKLFNQHIYKFIVNLLEIDHLGSAGVGVFIGILDVLKENKGTLVLVQPNPRVTEVLKLLDITTFYPVVDDPAKALSVLKLLDGIKSI